ncbi:ABC transporter ATP-binding protein [Floricoccus penangensis]|uniref:ABC transporter ATP-binding protein n=1 Tax=Floricoccus penangensis TaxID=1859475 RepID=UPI00203CBE6F|nr:ABC transporter ATP-binding protein [Floricoccus penangensis]URZ87027.1 ABC transporter ATP-binding protein/permease [Floricoccus penangensis]
MKKYFLKHKILNFTLIILTTITVGAQTINSMLLIPLMQAMTDKDINQFLRILLIFVAIFVVLVLANYFQTVVQTIVTQKQVNDIREDILTSVSNMNYEEFHSRKSSDYVSWITNDMNMVESEGFANFYNIITCIVTVILTALALLKLNDTILIVAIVLGLLMTIAPRLFDKEMRRAVENISQKNEKFTSISNNYLTGFDLLFHNERTKLLIEKIKISFTDLKEAKVKQSKVQASMMVVILLLNVIAQCSMLGLTGYYIIQDKLPIGAIMASVNLTGVLFNTIQSMVGAYSRAKANGNILDKYPVVERDDSGISKDFDNIISSKNLTYKYNDKSTITYPSFTFSKGKKYALIGSSGSGKTTLLKLLIGDLRKYQGNLNFDNDSYSELNVSSLHNNISIVDQSSHIFSDTVRNNLTLGLEFTDQEIREATNKAQITDYIESLENGYDTILKDTSDLSGGQAQRISLARALLFNRNIFLIDEGTSSLDKENARKVEDTILKMKDKTVIMITHHLREESKKDFDEVIEL